MSLHAAGPFQGISLGKSFYQRTLLSLPGFSAVYLQILLPERRHATRRTQWRPKIVFSAPTFQPQDLINPSRHDGVGRHNEPGPGFQLLLVKFELDESLFFSGPPDTYLLFHSISPVQE